MIQYTGLRYVPLYEGEFIPNKSYDNLSVVYSGADLYISKQPTTGQPLTDDNYWVKLPWEDFTDDITTLQTNIASLADQLDLTNAQVTQQKTAITNLQMATETQEENIATLRTAQNDLESSMDDLSREVIKLQANNIPTLYFSSKPDITDSSIYVGALPSLDVIMGTWYIHNVKELLTSLGWAETNLTYISVVMFLTGTGLNALPCTYIPATGQIEVTIPELPDNTIVGAGELLISDDTGAAPNDVAVYFAAPYQRETTEPSTEFEGLMTYSDIDGSLFYDTAVTNITPAGYSINFVNIERWINSKQTQLNLRSTPLYGALVPQTVNDYPNLEWVPMYDISDIVTYDFESEAIPNLLVLRFSETPATGNYPEGPTFVYPIQVAP